MSDIYILHENSEWIAPLHQAFNDRGIQAKELFLDEGCVDFSAVPPEGIFYNRMSASSHTRGHRFGPEFTRMVLTWLQQHGRRVINNLDALYLEVCKVSQYAALAKFGIKVPKTVAVVGKAQLLEATKQFGQWPLILKPNRGGKGLGVKLFHNIEEVGTYIEGHDYEEPLDGTWLVQQFIHSEDGYITRCEFVNRQFIYSVRVNTDEGFELCPADGCQIGNDFCPTAAPVNKFTISHEFDTHPIIGQYQQFLQATGIEISGIELIRDIHGNLYTYDVNTNTNYNRQAELAGGVCLTGMDAIAEFLVSELH